MPILELAAYEAELSDVHACSLQQKKTPSPVNRTSEFVVGKKIPVEIPSLFGMAVVMSIFVPSGE
jgi:hypothetical protein